jgi:hypothetical protein
VRLVTLWPASRGGLVGLCASLALAAAGPIWATVAAAPTAVAVVPLMLLLSPRLATTRPEAQLDIVDSARFEKLRS